MFAEVIQHQQGRRLDAFKKLVVGNLALRAEGRAQMVEELRYHHKPGWLAGFIGIINNGSRQVGFTTAGNTMEYQPAFR